MKLLIIGAGPAGVTVAETLRQYDARSSIVMLSSEPYPPYSPPAMLEYFQTGQKTHFWKGEDFAERLDLDYRSGAEVVALLPDEHAVKLANGKTLDYEAAVIATGSRLFAPVEGADMPGIYNFKSLSAAEALVKKVRGGKAKNALIVGAGFIGVEIALLLRDLGLEVTQIEMEDRVMPRMLDAETGGIVVDAMLERGIDVRLNTKATAFTGKKKAEAVTLESGETLTADLLVAATHLMHTPEAFGGDKDKAEKLLKKGIKLNQKQATKDSLTITWASDAELYAYLAQLEILRENKEKALEYMKKALKLCPEYGFVKNDLMPQWKKIEVE